MRLKRLAPGTISLVIGLAGLADTASAQLTGGQWRLPPSGASGGTPAVETRSQPTVFHPQAQPQTVLRRRPGAYNPYYPTATYTLVPAIITADGRIFANFGGGYEPVYRSCHNNAVVVGQPAVIGANGVVLSPAQPPTYTQPVPNQQTASQQLLPSNQHNRVVVRSAAQASCYSRDPYGRVLVYRF